MNKQPFLSIQVSPTITVIQKTTMVLQELGPVIMTGNNKVREKKNEDLKNNHRDFIIPVH